MTAPVDIAPGREVMCLGCDLRIIETPPDCGRDWTLPVDGCCFQSDEEGDGDE